MFVLVRSQSEMLNVCEGFEQKVFTICFPLTKMVLFSTKKKTRDEKEKKV